MTNPFAGFGERVGRLKFSPTGGVFFCSRRSLRELFSGMNDVRRRVESFPTSSRVERRFAGPTLFARNATGWAPLFTVVDFRRKGALPGLLSPNSSFAPSGLIHFPLIPRAYAAGLHSCAAARLVGGRVPGCARLGQTGAAVPTCAVRLATHLRVPSLTRLGQPGRLSPRGLNHNLWDWARRNPAAS